MITSRSILATSFLDVPAGGVHVVRIQFFDPGGQASKAEAVFVGAAVRNAAPTKADAAWLKILRREDSPEI